MRQIAITFSLVIGLAGGCIYVPRVPRHSFGPDVPALVGNARSAKPLRPGASSREQVERILGRPHEDHDQRWRYYWAEDVGTLYTLWNPFNESPEHPQTRTRMIEFRFDDGGILRHYRMRAATDYVAYEKIAASRPSEP